MTARTDIIMDHVVLQVRGQASATVWPGPLFGWFGTVWRNRLPYVWWRCILKLVQVLEQAWLIGVKAFGLAAVDALEQPMHPVA